MVLNVDGSRNRRLGIDYEDNYTVIDTQIDGASTLDTAITTYRWDNAGGNPERSIQVVQTGNQIRFFNLGNGTVSGGHFQTLTFPNSTRTDKFSYAVVDGILVMANGEKQIYSMEYSLPNTITLTSSRLLIRDFFGVEDRSGGVDITRGANVQTRPSDLSNEHLYNLRNQSWGIARVAANDEFVSDPIGAFRSEASRSPSNADTVTESLYPDAEDEDNRTIDRFFPEDLYKNPVGTSKAANGYFIIDALDRGITRIDRDRENRERFPQLEYIVSALPQDITPSGATCVTEFAGRVFYAGFTGEVVDGDSLSPKMSSYILFSKVVDNLADINLCYQEGDPTSIKSPEIIDTDGGFIRLNEAYGIKKIINLGSSLMVAASNGIWRVVGGDNGFTATQYIVEKITDRGCTSADSIAEIDNTFMFWSDDAIYHVAPDQFGSYQCTNITFDKIQKFYDAIDVNSKRKAIGAYDNYERKVRWIYDCATNNDLETKELILDIQLQAYYINTIKKIPNQPYPKVIGIYTGLPYQIVSNQTNIYVGRDLVLNGTDEVVLVENELSGVSQREIGYLLAVEENPNLSYTFGKYSNQQFRDWFSYDGVGVDAEAFMVTSYLSGDDFQRQKGLDYITTHFRRTETGYDVDMNPINPSSCLIQARWGWSNSDNSGKWGREFQAYRYRNLHLPLNSDDPYDTGFLTLVTRNKVRGTGRVLSLRFRTEPYKNLHLYGWSMIFSVTENV